MALCCLPRIRPFGRLRNDPKPPCSVIKSNPSGLDHGRLLFEIPLLEELGLAPGMGDSPSLPLSHRFQPSCLSLLCFSTSRGAGGGAGAFGSFCAAWSCTGVPAGSRCHRTPSGSHLDISAPHLPTSGQPEPPSPGNATAGTGVTVTWGFVAATCHPPPPFLTPSSRNSARNCSPQGHAGLSRVIPSPSPREPTDPGEQGELE